MVHRGLNDLVQVDLDVRQNRHGSLAELAPMASAILAAVMSRLASEGRVSPQGHSGFLLPIDGALVSHQLDYAELPPFADARAARSDPDVGRPGERFSHTGVDA